MLDNRSPLAEDSRLEDKVMNAAETVLALSWLTIFLWSLKALSAFVLAALIVSLPVLILGAIAD